MDTFPTAPWKALAAIVLFGVFQGPAWAQVDLPSPPGGQYLEPTEQEFEPMPGQLASLRFGAALALQGNLAMIGMPGFGSPENYSPGRGRVAIFTRSGGQPWKRVGSIDAPVRDGLEDFGERVALDGTIVLVGSIDRVFVFERIQRTWTFVQEITAAPGERLDGALGVEKGSLLVGASAPGKPGVVHVLARGSHGLWRVVQNLRGFQREADDAFGLSLAVAHGTLVIGAPGYHDAQGAAFVYQHVGHFFVPYEMLLASDRRPADTFGASVATDGDLIAVGAFNANARFPSPDGCGAYGGSGEAYVFGRRGLRWTQQQILLHPNSDCVYGFASFVAISHDYVAASTLSLFPSQLGGTLVYQRVQGRYEPKYFSVLEDVDANLVALEDKTLITSAPVDRFYEVGYAVAYQLDAPE